MRLAGAATDETALVRKCLENQLICRVRIRRCRACEVRFRVDVVVIYGVKPAKLRWALTEVQSLAGAISGNERIRIGEERGAF